MTKIKCTIVLTVVEAKREEFVDDALINAKSSCEELKISSEPPKTNQEEAYIWRRKSVLRMDELNLDQAHQDINKEFQVERLRLQAFVDVTEPGCKKRTHESWKIAEYEFHLKLIIFGKLIILVL
ncbi:hypothetical protein TNCV_2385551 [Trichonephila clavipes]|nr:hypothetical protein TNCV_2385551 [Trichonephila clavipes]